jgi:uncharacterized protein (DUF2384 family)
MSLAIKNTVNDNEVVTHAVCEAAEWLGLTREQLAQIIGVSKSNVARYRSGTASIKDPKSFELSLILIRIYRSLFAIVGGDKSKIRHWVKTPNHHLSSRSPLTMMSNVEGLTTVIRYLDAMRGRL